MWQENLFSSLMDTRFSDRFFLSLHKNGVKSLGDFNAFMRDVSKDVIETLLDEELTDHVGFEKYDLNAKVTGNTRNGYTPKTVKSKFGEIGLDVPRDRKSEFEPQLVKKRKKDISGPGEVQFYIFYMFLFI
jgi:putative transposase